MNIKKYAIRSLITIWAMATATTAALAYALAGVAPARDGVADIRIGERAGQTRIAIICETQCTLEIDARGELFLRGAQAAIDLDLTKRSKRLTKLTGTPVVGGARLAVEASEAVASVGAKHCTVGGEEAVCADFFFDDKIASVAKPILPATPSLNQRRIAAVDIAPVTNAVPALREGAEERYETFASLGAPERLEPANGAMLAKLQPIDEPQPAERPKFRSEEPLIVFGVFDFKERAEALLNKSLTPAHCSAAEAKLQSDPWALASMVDLGLCSSARGDAVEGDAIFARILEYTPDNYAALTGRALIAEQAGEYSVARKYYQDALNALPPIEESKRIVAAMAALDGA